MPQSLPPAAAYRHFQDCHVAGRIVHLGQVIDRDEACQHRYREQHDESECRRFPATRKMQRQAAGGQRDECHEGDDSRAPREKPPAPPRRHDVSHHAAPLRCRQMGAAIVQDDTDNQCSYGMLPNDERQRDNGQPGGRLDRGACQHDRFSLSRQPTKPGGKQLHERCEQGRHRGQQSNLRNARTKKEGECREVGLAHPDHDGIRASILQRMLQRLFNLLFGSQFDSAWYKLPRPVIFRINEAGVH